MFDELRHYTIPVSKRKDFLMTGMEIDVFQASGFYNNCYTQKPGEYVYASCAYYIEGSQVEFMELFA